SNIKGTLAELVKDRACLVEGWALWRRTGPGGAPIAEAAGARTRGTRGDEACDPGARARDWPPSRVAGRVAAGTPSRPPTAAKPVCDRNAPCLPAKVQRRCPKSKTQGRKKCAAACTSCRGAAHARKAHGA